MKYFTAVLCAGQGAQTVGMGRDLAESFPECRALFAKANEVLGYDLQKIIFEGPEEELTKSNHCQPAVFTVTAACFQALKIQCRALTVKASAGLSLGEWTALHLAGAITFEDGLRVLAARGRYMQEACEEQEGAMVSVIGLASDKLREIAAQSGVEIANYNSPEQIVLSGRKQNILEAEKMAKGSGAKRAILLNVAGAYHSLLMKSAGEKMNTLLAGILLEQPRFPVMSNVTGRPHGSPEEIKQNMVRQVTSSVKWVDCVQSLEKLGVNSYLECGPGRVLSGLVKRNQPQVKLCNVQNCQSLNATVTVLSADLSFPCLPAAGQVKWESRY
ncbi:MAG: ACP S-malonyltransferase [Kiritimatiellia bacterium]|nr:ACP S-malonyltransferase [Kiritimatiellia bacterium]